MPARPVLREMRASDVPAVLDVQEPAAVAGLSSVFPQDRYPFPREAIAAPWREEVADPRVVPPYAELLAYELHAARG